MSDIFISHVEEDHALVAQIAAGLESAGFSTWYYERDSVPGIPFVRQIPDVIDDAQAVVILISADALTSPHVDREIVEAYRGGKRLIPLLHGLTHSEFRQQRRDWALMVGAAVFVTLPATGVSAIIPRIIAGLQQMGVVPSGTIDFTSTPPAAGPPVSESGPTPQATTARDSMTTPIPKPQRVPENAGAGDRIPNLDKEQWATALSRYPPDWQGSEAIPATSNRRRFIGAFLTVALLGSGSAYWFLIRDDDGGDNSRPTATEDVEPVYVVNKPDVELWGEVGAGGSPTRLPEGYELRMTGTPNKEVDGIEWVEVEMVSVGVIGWINSDDIDLK